jgi:hypothetical protein
VSARRKPRLIAAAIAIGAAALAIGFAFRHERPEPEPPANAPATATETPPPSPPATATETPSPSPPAAAAPNAPPDAASPSARVEATVARMNEAVLMAHLREVARMDSAQTIEIARAGNKKFPDSPDAPERYSILIHALVTQNQLSEARGEAEYMVNHFPDSAWVRGIEGFTGAHRHRNIRVNDAGQLEYY